VISIRQRLVRLGTSKPFRRREVLLLVGTDSNEVLLIEAGAVNVVLTAPDGVESVVGPYGPGELIGDIGVMRQEPRSATVIGQQDGSAVHVPGAAFRELAQRDTSLMAWLLYDVAYRRQLNADVRQLAMATQTVRGRVVIRLLDWADEIGERDGETVVVRGFTQHQLAQAIAASRQSVEDALHDLRSAGLLDTGHLRFTLLRPSLLREQLFRSGWRV
jgi:CRP/FNR family transcriptional regulator, cyclic AMP receptor protein